MPRLNLPISHPVSHIKLVALDYESGNASIVTTEGQIFIERLSAPADHGLVTRSTFIPAESRMEIVAAGEKISITLGTVRDAVSVPVVYLDQNHWIDFARWRKNPDVFDEAKRPFFETLAKAVTEERIITPLASAHLTETSRRGGTSRLELAATMLHYSRGWQLRSVLGLRRAELRALFGGTSVTKDEAITLTPDVIFDTESRPLSDAPSDPVFDPTIARDLGPELSGLVQRQVWACTLVSLLIDDQPETDSGRDAATRWAQSFEPLATSMRNNAKAKALSRDLTRTRFISDLGTDLPAAASESGISPEQFGDWLQNSAEAAISATPGLGRMREVLHLRLSNADDKWERNDLNDWLHLCYAAGYCDLVLGEKKTINYLTRAAPKVPLGAVLHRRARDAITDLTTLLDEAPS